jgi:ribonuclease P protein component
MLPKSKRLKKKSDIEKLFNQGNSVKGQHFICKYLSNSLNYNRPCFTIAKKLKLNVIKRNRLRRQMIFAFKEQVKDDGQQEYYDFIFILYKIPTSSVSRYKIFLNEFSNIISKITTSNV